MLHQPRKTHRKPCTIAGSASPWSRRTFVGAMLNTKHLHRQILFLEKSQISESDRNRAVIRRVIVVFGGVELATNRAQLTGV